MIGLYAIVNTRNRVAYVGSTNNVTRRFKEHKTRLRQNKHHCKHLQNAWNKHTEQLFEFKQIASCETMQKARDVEQAFLDCFFDDLYNSNKSAIGFGSEDHPSKKPDWHMKTLRQRFTPDELKKKWGFCLGVKRDSAVYKKAAAKRLQDPEYTKKLSEACKGKRALVTCPHCGLTGGGGNMRRYHMDKCKDKK